MVWQEGNEKSTKMTYNELYKVAYKYIDNDSNFPNAFVIAQKLNIRTKNSIEAKRDFKNVKNPLEDCNGCLSIVNGEYVIYYNEKSPYNNFVVAHEIAHYFLHHYSDGSDQHHDANILAAILVAPKKSVVKNKIKNEAELSEKYKIPIETAQIYWDFLNVKPQNKNNLWIVITALLVMLIIFLIYFLLKQPDKSLELSHPTPNPTSTPMATESIENNSTSTIVTIHGEKYHKTDCRYIENKDNLIELTVETAENAGYKPCKICF